MESQDLTDSINRAYELSDTDNTLSIKNVSIINKNSETFEKMNKIPEEKQTVKKNKPYQFKSKPVMGSQDQVRANPVPMSKIQMKNKRIY